MSSGPRLLLPAIVVLAVAGGVLALSARTSPSRFHGFGNHGRGVDAGTVAAGERARLLEDGYATVLRILGERAGTRFYIGSGLRSDARCYFTASVHGGVARLDSAGCPADFPSDEQPILDHSWYRQEVGDRYPAITRLAGFAADGVTAVGVRDPAGRVSWTPVVDNVFGAISVGRAAVIMARAVGGEIVYTATVGGASTLADGYKSP